jgi:hypothetical protein
MRGGRIPATRHCRVAILRGRKTVRADRRLRTDEKHIRAQSPILCKTPALSLFLPITVFLVRMRFSSVPKTRLARGARNGGAWHATAIKTS